ncbi:MAG TPA: M48 family metallopeptidase [Azospirillaceae bacterium]|nr:M48 family metallopeptidase [Azospirillaceae bacterium]
MRVLFCLLPLLAAAPALAQGFDPQAATDAYLATVPPEARARSDAYFEGGYWIILWGLLYAIGVSALMLFSGYAAAVRNEVSRLVRGRPFPTAFLTILALFLTAGVLSLPWSWYTEFFREHQYGLSNQTWLAWAKELVLAGLLGSLAMALLFGVFYALIRRAPRVWWAWGAGASVAFLALNMLITPVFLAPLFNEYKPVRPGPVRDAVLSMARANGVPAGDVWEFDASRQHDRISANVSGLLGTTRISLNDNLLRRSTAEEVQAVMAHELGHYVLNHIYTLLLMFGLIILGGLFFIDRLFGAVHRRFGARWGVAGLSDPAGLPLVVALFQIYFTLMTPVTNTIIRGQEAEADLFGLNAARQPDAFATVALKLGQYRKLDPSPLEEFVFFDHPSGRSRILMAMRFKAEQEGVGEPQLQMGALHDR